MRIGTVVRLTIMRLGTLVRLTIMRLGTLVRLTFMGLVRGVWLTIMRLRTGVRLTFIRLEKGVNQPLWLKLNLLFALNIFMSIFKDIMKNKWTHTYFLVHFKENTHTKLFFSMVGPIRGLNSLSRSGVFSKVKEKCLSYGASQSQNIYNSLYYLLSIDVIIFSRKYIT